MCDRKRKISVALCVCACAKRQGKFESCTGLYWTVLDCSIALMCTVHCAYMQKDNGMSKDRPIQVVSVYAEPK